jgi:hypothetical protein
MMSSLPASLEPLVSPIELVLRDTTGPPAGADRSSVEDFGQKQDVGP